MSQSINLIPRQEIAIQTETKLLSLSTIISFVLLGLISIVAIYFLVVSYNLKKQGTELDANIESLRSSIKSQSALEIVSRNLDKKYDVLSSIFKNRSYSSRLLFELYSRKPEGVSISDFSLREGGLLEISGKADIYLLVADFTNALVNENFENGDPLLKKLFTEVTINAVNLESDGAGFSISVKFDESKLKEQL